MKYLSDLLLREYFYAVFLNKLHDSKLFQSLTEKRSERTCVYECTFKNIKYLYFILKSLKIMEFHELKPITEIKRKFNSLHAKFNHLLDLNI